MRTVATLLHKPAQSLAMTFSDDPHLGMTSANFSGSAVVYLATASFTRQQTAALQVSRLPYCRHPERVHIGFQDLFLLAALVEIHLAHAHDRAQRLGIETVALGFGIDFADIFRVVFFSSSRRSMRSTIAFS